MRFAVSLLVLLSALTLFAGLGHPAISDSDEAFYAEAGREMLAGGDWLTPHFNYENRFQKPILFYWIVAASYAAAGINEAAARFGSALAGLGIVLITFACGRRWYDAPTGLLGGVILATSFGCVNAARLSLPDLPLAFFVTLATWAGFTALFDRERRSRRWWLIAAVAAALGFLTKGPLAVALPVFVLVVPVWLERGWRRLRPKELVAAAAVFVALSAPWYVAMAQVHGASYLRGFFIGDNLERFATTAFNDHRPVYFYVPIVLGGMLPWSPFFALGIRPIWRHLRQRLRPGRHDVRVLAWALVPFLLFTASVGKQPRYILPMLAPLGLLLAVAIRRAITLPAALPSAQPRLFRWMAAASGLLVALLGVALWRTRPLLFAVPSAPLTWSAVLLVVAGLAVSALAASRAWRRSPLGIAVAGALLALVLRNVILATPGLDPVEQMASRLVAHRQGGERVTSYHVFVRNLVFYTHIQEAGVYSDGDLLDFLATPDRVLCVLPAADLQRLQAAHPDQLSRVTRLESITYFDAPTAKVRSFLWPSAERDLQTAVLIANR